jgi:hypothetical protein
MPGRHWLLKTLGIDHEIAHSDLTTVPKKKMKYYENLPLQNETIFRLHDQQFKLGRAVVGRAVDADSELFGTRQ